jgi:hypothetical protein
MQISIIDKNLVSDDKKGNLSKISKVVDIKDIKMFAAIALKYHICCGIFKDGIRRIDHLENIQFLQFDFDNGKVSVEDVIKKFPINNMIILASKSHMVDKNDGNGTIPRFHMFLPLKTPIVDAEFYSFLVKYISYRQEIPIDRRAVDCTRYFFKHSKLLYGRISAEDLNPEEYKDNFKKEKEEKDRKRREQEQKLEQLNKNSNISLTDRKETAKILIEQRVKESIQGQEGNNKTFIAACFAVRCGLPDMQIYEIMEWYNNNYCKPKWNKREIDNKVKYAKLKVDYSDYFTPSYITYILKENNKIISQGLFN